MSLSIRAISRATTRRRKLIVLLIGVAGLLYLNAFRIGISVLSPSTSALKPSVLNASSSRPTVDTSTYAPSTSPNTPLTLSEEEFIRQAGGTTTQSQNVQVPESCTGTPYSMPSPTSLETANTGLTKTVDAPTYYQVYGTNLPAIRRAITDCPYRQGAGNYQAATSYQLNWSYSARATGTSCQLTNIRIGLHINQIMPLFVATSSTPESVASSWNTFANNLTTHESGHIAIDTQYAEKLAAALENMGIIDCSRIGQQTQTTIDSYVTMLNGANDLYDSQTDHGTTQGAVL